MRYVELMGGPFAARKDQPAKITRVWNDQSGRYHDPKGWQIKGVECGSVTIPTRIHQWSITVRQADHRAPESAQGFPEGRSAQVVQIKNENFEIQEGLPPWSSVNNCMGYGI